MNRLPFFYLFILLLTAGSCNYKKNILKTNDGYDLNKPEIFNMPDVLNEISGITFNKGNPDTVYAEQDEEGKLFHFKLGDKKTVMSKFGKHGDYEDVSICDGFVIMLRSDGVLFTFPLTETNEEKPDNVKEWDEMLPPGEYEGLSSNDATGQVYVLCKHCSDDKTSKKMNGYIFSLGKDGGIKASGNFEINVEDIEAKSGSNKINLHPSALALNPFTREWYIISSVNKLLIVAKADWKIKEVYALRPDLFLQPEGIAFDNKGTLYISNEQNTAAYGTILKFVYREN